jgi:hypothetical protein
MRLSLLSLSILLVVTGCGAPRRVVLNPSLNSGVSLQPGGQVNAGGGGGGGGGGGAVMSGGTPIERLNRVDAHMRTRSYTRVGPAVRNTNMPAQGLVAYAINAQPGQCFLPIAVGADGADLNMIVLDPMGRPVGHNVLPDSNPWVRFCPSMGGRYVARLQLASGQGEYYYALYSGATQQDPQVVVALGGQVQTQRTAQLDNATQARLQAIDQRLSQNRYRRVGDTAGVVLGARETNERQLNLQQGFCYAFASLGGEGTRDTDLSVLDGTGQTMQQDTSTDIDAVVEYCPPATGTYLLRALLYTGEGPVFVAGWVQQRQSATNNTPEPTQVIGDAQQSQGLDERYALLDSDIRARGYEHFGDRAQGQLTQGQDRDFNLELEGGKCYAIVAVGGNSVRDLDLALTDPRGREVDSDEGTDARPIVRVCADDSGTFLMKVKMTQGQGRFVYHAYRWPRGTRGPFGLRGLSWVRLSEQVQLLGVEGFEPSANFTPGRGTLRRQGADAGHNLELPGNECFSIVAVGGDGVRDLDLTLSSGRNDITADGTHDAMPRVTYCTQSAGTYRLKVEAADGSGDYFYQVFQRTGG